MVPELIFAEPVKPEFEPLRASSAFPVFSNMPVPEIPETAPSASARYSIEASLPMIVFPLK